MTDIKKLVKFASNISFSGGQVRASIQTAQVTLNVAYKGDPSISVTISPTQLMAALDKASFEPQFEVTPEGLIISGPGKEPFTIYAQANPMEPLKEEELVENLYINIPWVGGILHLSDGRATITTTVDSSTVQSYGYYNRLSLKQEEEKEGSINRCYLLPPLLISNLLPLVNTKAGVQFGWTASGTICISDGDCQIFIGLNEIQEVPDFAISMFDEAGKVYVDKKEFISTLEWCQLVGGDTTPIASGEGQLLISLSKVPAEGTLSSVMGSLYIPSVLSSLKATKGGGASLTLSVISFDEGGSFLLLDSGVDMDGRRYGTRAIAGESTTYGKDEVEEEQEMPEDF